MKAEIYIFGNFADGYSQYPDNYSHDFWESIGKKRKSESEIIYHREGSLTYYVYTREISKVNNTFIGIGYVFNDILIKDFTPLFSIFEDVITNIVVTGELLEFTNEGKLTTKTKQLYTHTKELQRISDYLNNKLNSIGKIVEKLPPTNFAISSAEWKNYSYKDILEIQKSIVDYSNIRVVKGEGYNTETLSSYAGKLNALSKEKNEALQSVEKLKKNITELEKKQKNYKLVIWLILIIFLGFVLAWNFINDKNLTISNLKDEIETQEQEIESKSDTITSLESEIINKTGEIKEKNSELYNITNELNNKDDSLKYYQKENETLKLNLSNKEDELRRSKKNTYMPDNLPIYIKDIEIANVYKDESIQTMFGNKLYSYNTMYLQPRISYVGIKSYTDVLLKVKLYRPNGILSTGTSSSKNATYEQIITVISGENTAKLTGWGNNQKGNWEKGKYRFEIWYKDICLKSKEFWIY